VNGAPPNTLWAETFIDGLVRGGVHHVALAPGSRSTPLVLAAAARSDVRIFTHIDERAAAFFALGVAKGGGGAAAVLTTAGTAAAYR
jgi:2-succinyl-5-enolpyruvyl-6-hydroxy-3-cyclohexene-1-carboxylate synthase